MTEEQKTMPHTTKQKVERKYQLIPSRYVLYLSYVLDIWADKQLVKQNTLQALSIMISLDYQESVVTHQTPFKSLESIQ
jgi:hypothetical protein